MNELESAQQELEALWLWRIEKYKKVDEYQRRILGRLERFSLGIDKTRKKIANVKCKPYQKRTKKGTFRRTSELARYEAIVKTDKVALVALNAEIGMSREIRQQIKHSEIEEAKIRAKIATLETGGKWT